MLRVIRRKGWRLPALFFAWGFIELKIDGKTRCESLAECPLCVVNCPSKLKIYNRNSDALVKILLQTGYARLWIFDRHNSVALVQCVVTDLRCKTVGLFQNRIMRAVE